MHKKFRRIKALLDFADKQQAAISDEFSQYLDGDIPTSVQIKTKNYFENARSVLDYIASDICTDILKLSEKHKPYFPLYSSSREHFDKFCNSNFPGIERLSPELHKLLKSIQPFESTEFACFKLLAQYANANKHRDLTAQSMIIESPAASRAMVVRFGDIASSTRPQGKFDGYIVADETRSHPFLGSDFIIENIGRIIQLNPDALRFISPKFTDSGVDVITTLISIQNAVRKVVQRFADPLYKCTTAD